MPVVRRPYDYSTRRGVLRVSWTHFQRMVRRLAGQIAAAGPDVVVGVGRGGMIPAAEIALRLRVDLFPAALSRRVGDRVVAAEPAWRAPIARSCAGRRVVVVDDIADTGRTLAEAKDAIRASGAASVVTVALAAHTWAKPVPDLVAVVSDALIVWPWGRYVLEDGRWRLHPEYREALRMQHGRAGAR